MYIPVNQHKVFGNFSCSRVSTLRTSLWELRKRYIFEHFVLWVDIARSRIFLKKNLGIKNVRCDNTFHVSFHYIFTLDIFCTKLKISTYEDNWEPEWNPNSKRTFIALNLGEHTDSKVQQFNTVINKSLSRDRQIIYNIINSSHFNSQNMPVNINILAHIQGN